jgi:hypothetical protein
VSLLNQRASVGLLAFDLAFVWVTVTATVDCIAVGPRWALVVAALLAILAISVAVRTAYLLIRRSRWISARRA